MPRKLLTQPQAELSQKEARAIVLKSQLLDGKKDPTALQIIEHLGYVQIDTISVVERAHHHIIWTRNHAYRPKDLDNLVAKRKVFEYWAHAAAYLPMRDYRFTLPMKAAFKTRETSWFPKNPKMEQLVLQRIKAEGPLMSKDFEKRKMANSGWWDWKPAKKALERLFLEGRLEITRREGFQKRYDLPENVIPSSTNFAVPRDNEFAKFLIMSTLRHHGIATADEMAYLRNSKVKSSVAMALKQMVLDQEVTPVHVTGIPHTYYGMPKTLSKAAKPSPSFHILSPFDNLVIQRRKLQRLFNFEYQIECYVPGPKRKYGYFSLPILRNGQFVARIDCKADRKLKTLVIHSIHPETPTTRSEVAAELQTKIRPFADFNNCRF